MRANGVGDLKLTKETSRLVALRSKRAEHEDLNRGPKKRRTRLLPMELDLMESGASVFAICTAHVLVQLISSRTRTQMPVSVAIRPRLDGEENPCIQRA